MAPFKLSYGLCLALVLNSGCDASSESTDSTDGGKSGAPGTAGSPGVGGAPGSAGSPTVAGSPGSAGSPAAGAPTTGGAPGSAGSGPLAGAAGSGGSTSEGGSENTGGSKSMGGSKSTGGTTSMAGASGSAGAPSGGAGSASLDCEALTDKLLCEDFESAAAGPAVAANGWSPVATASGTLTIDGTHALGKQALHVHTQGNGHAYLQVSPFAPPSNSFFGRMSVWVKAFPTAPDYAHYTLVEAAGQGAGVIRPVGGQYIPGKGNLFGPGSDGGPTGDWTNWKESAKAEGGRWLCIEWELAAADSAIRVWIDGEAKPDLSVSKTMHGGTNVDFVFPTFNKIWLGWWLYQSGPTPDEFDVWIDDIALTTKRAPCPSKT